MVDKDGAALSVWEGVEKCVFQQRLERELWYFCFHAFWLDIKTCLDFAAIACLDNLDIIAQVLFFLSDCNECVCVADGVAQQCDKCV